MAALREWSGYGFQVGFGDLRPAVELAGAIVDLRHAFEHQDGAGIALGFCFGIARP